MKVVSFNCTNVNTCTYALNELFVEHGADIVLHWLLDWQLHRLDEIVISDRSH